MPLSPESASRYPFDKKALQNQEKHDQRERGDDHRCEDQRPVIVKLPDKVIDGQRQRLHAVALQENQRYEKVIPG